MVYISAKQLIKVLFQLIPISTFCLGTWQVKRKKWKEDLLEKLESITKMEPVPLPTELALIELFYLYSRKVKV